MRVTFAIEWTLATALALVMAHIAIEIVGAALLGWALFFLLPLIGGVAVGLPVGLLQSIVLRRHGRRDGSWTLLTLFGFMGAWTIAFVLAAAFFVAPYGLSPRAAFLSCAMSTPIIGLAQARALRRWTPHASVWVLTSAAAWTTLGAIEMFWMGALPAVDRLSGWLVSVIAGYATASSVGATLLGGTLAGAITGIALAFILQPARSRAPGL